MSNHLNLFDKYDTPVPRYTSYPPVPYWKNNLSRDLWSLLLEKSMQKEDVTWSLYLHLPFCESLCTFCACNNVITKDHSKEDKYIQAIHKEWELYLQKVPILKERKIRQIHLGGGSPTFFNAANLTKLLDPILTNLNIDFSQFEGAVEVDPRRCTFEQLKVLRDLGFNRISLGVQDFDIEVQKNVNRIQPFEVVQNCVLMARELGYKSINFDLIYGLPGQTSDSIKETAKKTMELKPDRIALYSLAVVPWMRPAQNRFQRMEIKKGSEKRALFDAARDIFSGAGYIPLGIDHFALPSDSIADSSNNESMHRNFMGYTEYATDVLLGLGVSAISESLFGFQQNKKTLDEYYKDVLEYSVIPVSRGHLFTDEDLEIKSYILNLMTQYWTPLRWEIMDVNLFADMVQEGLVQVNKDKLIITEQGKPFTRHICNKIDKYAMNQVEPKRFSSGV